MKRTWFIVISALVLVGLTAGSLVAGGCGGVPSAAVATVGDASVTKKQLNDLLAQAKTQMESQGMAFPETGTATYDELVASVMDYLVESEIVTQGAQELGVSVSDDEVTEQIAALQEQYGGEDALLGALKEAGMTMTLLKWSLEQQALTQKVAAEVVEGAEVTSEELRAYWDENEATLRKKKATATYAKAKKTIESTLLDEAKGTLWTEWLATQADKLGVEYAAGYDPAELSASPSPSASAAASGAK